MSNCEISIENMIGIYPIEIRYKIVTYDIHSNVIIVLPWCTYYAQDFNSSSLK